MAATELEAHFAGRPRVVIINGPAGVGKTTTSRALASMALSGACIHGDDLKSFVVRRDGPVASGLGYRNGAAIATTFVEGGYDLVVFDFVFEGSGHVQEFLDAYNGPAPVHMFTLWAPLETVVTREAQRHAQRPPLAERVTDCHATLAANLSDLGETIQTDHRDVAAVGLEILSRLRDGDGELYPGSAKFAGAA